MPVTIVAEGGCEHAGSLDEGKRIIDLALEAGADFVKFQLYDVTELVSKRADPAQWEKLAALEMTPHEASLLVAHAPGKVAFSVFDHRSLAVVNELDVPFIKLGSGELSDFPLVRAVAALRKPTVLSTGMHDDQTVWRAEATIAAEDGWLDYHKHLTLMHCVSAYPASGPLDMGRMIRLDAGFKVGYSDHTTTPMAAQMAVALGASMIEAHVTTGKGPDAEMAWRLDVADSGWPSVEDHTQTRFGGYVRCVRAAEEAMQPPGAVGVPEWGGDPLNVKEFDTARSSRKSLAAARAVLRGDVWTEDSLTCMRPGTGIPAGRWDEFIGKRAERDYDAGELLR